MNTWRATLQPLLHNETVAEPQYQFSDIKCSLIIVSAIASSYLMILISIIFQIEQSNVSYIMLLVFVYALFAGYSLISIYSKATVNPLRSIRVRALEASYYVALLLMPLFSVLGFFPAKHVVVWSVRYGNVMIIAALIFIFNGCGIRVLRVVDWSSMEISRRAMNGGVLFIGSLQLRITFSYFVLRFSTMLFWFDAISGRILLKHMWVQCFDLMLFDAFSIMFFFFFFFFFFSS